eukprot:Nk52_evm16s1967 gene=Nk52_evmTU16s1967
MSSDSDDDDDMIITAEVLESPKIKIPAPPPAFHNSSQPSGAQRKTSVKVSQAPKFDKPKGTVSFPPIADQSVIKQTRLRANEGKKVKRNSIATHGLYNFAFDILGLSPKDRIFAVLDMFSKFNFLKNMEIKSLLGVVYTIEKESKHRPFSNFERGLVAVQELYSMLIEGQAMQYFDTSDIFAMLLVTLGQFISTKAKYDNFHERASGSYLTSIFSGEFPVQQNVGYRLIDILDSFNILDKYTHEERNAIKRNVCTYARATTFESNSAIQKDLEDFLFNRKPSGGERLSLHDTTTLASCIVYICSTGLCLQPFDQSLQWCTKRNKELMDQGNEEAEMGIPYSPFCSPHFSNEYLLGLTYSKIFCGGFLNLIVSLLPQVTCMKVINEQNAALLEEMAKGIRLTSSQVKKARQAIEGGSIKAKTIENQKDFFPIFVTQIQGRLGHATLSKSANCSSNANNINNPDVCEGDAHRINHLIERYLGTEELEELEKEVDLNPKNYWALLREKISTVVEYLELANIFADGHSVEQIIPPLIKNLTEVLGAQTIIVSMFSSGNNSFKDYRLSNGNIISSDIEKEDLLIRMLKTQELVEAPNAESDDGEMSKYLAKMHVPVRNLISGRLCDNKGNVICAVKAFNSLGSGSFTEADKGRLCSLCRILSPHLRDFLNFKDVLADADQNLRILTLNNMIASELSSEKLLPKVMTETSKVLNADRSALFVYDPSSNELWSKVAENAKEIRFPSNMGIAGEAFTRGVNINIKKAYEDKRFNKEVDRKTGYKTNTLLCVPVRNHRGKIEGVVEAINKTEGYFTQADENLLENIASQISLALNNSRMYEEELWMKNYNDSIINSMTHAVIATSDSGVVAKINKATEKLFGLLEGDSFVGSHVSRWISGKSTILEMTIDSILKAGEEAQDIKEIQLTLPNGVTIWANATVIPLRSAEGFPLGCIIILEDLSSEKRLKNTMNRYLTKELAEQLVDAESSLGGKMVKASVLFADIVSFTTISEDLGPVETVSMLNEYFTAMVDVILENKGILDKYIGDCIMAVFGAPVVGPDDSDHAVSAAIEMMALTRGLNKKRSAENKQEIMIRIGIHTDTVVSGNIGSERRMDFTVIGDGVNLASRLEGANKEYGTSILISQGTLESCKNKYLIREVDKLRVKGKTQGIKCYEVMDQYTDSQFPNISKVLEIYSKALALYKQREWKKAMGLFADIIEQFNPNDTLSKVYKERCELYLEDPPSPDWDGVWVMKTK